MDGLPVTIRLLDPPLHEFLPHTDADVRRRGRGRPASTPPSCCAAPRSCTSPTRCSATAAAASASPIPRSTRCRPAPSSRRPARSPPSGKAAPIPEIMIPLVATGEELKFLRALTDRTAKQVFAEKRARARLPGRHHDRAAARRPARRRDRRGRRVLLLRHQRPDPDHLRHQPRRRRPLPATPIVEKGIFETDPFVTPRPGRRRRADPDRRRARPRGPAATSSSASAASTAATRPRSPSARSVGLDYVSCSPYRVPIARLAAAQAALAARSAGAREGPLERNRFRCVASESRYSLQHQSWSLIHRSGSGPFQV